MAVTLSNGPASDKFVDDIGATMPVVAINDVKSFPPATYQKGERLVRCKLASVYRLVDIFGWNRGISNHITARVTRDGDEYLINPLGLLYHEVTASSLSKVNLKGSVIDPGTIGLGIDKQGWLLHSAVHEARPDVRCVIHLNTPATVAVSCTKSGLLPISQEAMIIGDTAVYDPSTLATSYAQETVEGDAATRRERRFAEERAAIAAILSEKSTDCMLLMIRNHGLLALGQSIEEAWFVAFNAVLACESQLRLASIGEDELVLPPKEAQQAAHYVGRTPLAVQLRPGESAGSSGWRRGELEFEALMRRLDAAGYRTGHVYRLGQIRQAGTAASTLQRPLADIPDGVAVTEPMTPRDAAALVRKTASLGRGLRGLRDVEIPPATSSFATTFYEDETSRAIAVAEAKAKSLSLSRTHWLNTPNTYLRRDIEEVGTPNPKMIAHWTEYSDEQKRHTCGVAVAIDNPNQFAPQGEDPNEFRHQQKKVKERYYKDVKNAGPTSRILEGLDLEIDDVTDKGPSTSPRAMSPRGTLLRLDPANPPVVEPGHVVVVGAASKGIISREQRHNAGVYQSVYSPNPFDRVTDDDLERYRENMERKAKGLPSLEEEEAAARIEEARRAAEIARQAIEAAAREVKPESQKSRLRLVGVYREPSGLPAFDQSTTLADVPTSILCSSSTFACLTETDKLHSTSHSAYSSRLGLEKSPDSDSLPAVLDSSLSSKHAPHETTDDCDVPEAYHQTQCSNSTNRGILLRRHSATRCWYWPQKFTVRSSPFTFIAPTKQHGLTESVHMTEERTVLGPRFLKRHKTITGISLTNRDNNAEVPSSLIGYSVSTTAVPLQFEESQPTFWRSRGVVHFRHSVNSTVSPCGSVDKGNECSHSFKQSSHLFFCLLQHFRGEELPIGYDRVSSYLTSHQLRGILSRVGNKLYVADCSLLEFDAHPVAEMSLEDYLIYWRSFHSESSNETRLLYLKDWHYFRRPGNQCYYELPLHFSSDWMNEFWKVRPDSDDDFRFVYLGTRGTWTPLHADVYRSFSWSANIVGQKRWWFFPPGEEKKLQQANGNQLPVDIRALDLEQMAIKYALFDQFPGQAVFVPSGWYHEVLNVTDCVSINHNWFNASNVAQVWEHLQEQLDSVEKSTEDVRDTPAWNEQCQVCLRALTGINFHEFLVLLKYIIATRWPGTDPIKVRSVISHCVEAGDAIKEANTLSNFETELDVMICSQLERDPFLLNIAKECSPREVFQEQMEEFDLAKSHSDNWLRQLDFCGAASVLHAFCNHPRVHQLKLISGNLAQHLTTIKWTKVANSA
ncbi:Protein hu-li tai shao [Fasciola gigantica]|uniref:Protein hu-li tai shao n=1 Tax=Fasciola gigantica TaxID=46835 RepID=A0A504YUD8_FASGI|nr:Protein hu-li tai shao [Fasciola gigantica]